RRLGAAGASGRSYPTNRRHCPRSARDQQEAELLALSSTAPTDRTGCPDDPCAQLRPTRAGHSASFVESVSLSSTSLTDLRSPPCGFSLWPSSGASTYLRSVLDARRTVRPVSPSRKSIS